MVLKTWAVEKDNTIQCQQLTAEYLNQVVKMMETAFFRSENVCTAIGLPEDSQALAEVNEMTREVAKEGISVIAIDKKTNKVIGSAINKIIVDSSEEPPLLQHFRNSWKQKKSLAILDFMADIENMCNLFEVCQVDCFFEILFVGTLPESRGKGIAKRLCEASIEIAKDLLNGINVKVPLDQQELSLEPVPKACSSIFTSFITQRIGKQLGFRIAAEKSYNELEYEGEKMSSVIGKETPGLTLEYMKL